MGKISDEELERLALDRESDRVERKAYWSGGAPEQARWAVCAFSNDLPNHRQPGMFIVGVNDDGTPSGADTSDGLLRTLADIKTDGGIVPPPSMTVEKRMLRGKPVAVVVVEPALAPPVRYKGNICVRVGPRRSVATAQDEVLLSERRRGRDRPYDIQPVPSATLADIDALLFEREYLPNAVSREVLAANERTLAQRLASCRMVAGPDDPTPTVLGLLALGISPRDWFPGAYIQFIRHQGATVDSPILDAMEIDGPVGQMLRRAEEKLESHNRQEVDVVGGDLERRTSPYPKIALQQLLRNAVMHRAYENTNAPIRLTWFSDRIELQSPGGPFGVVTVENFASPGLTDYRNPGVAEAMKVLGFVQKYGMGIELSRGALAGNGNPPPRFEVSPTHVLVKIGMRE